ncbi:MAG: COX15/CtaA family protein [Acidimicrobiales bacterium]
MSPAAFRRLALAVLVALALLVITGAAVRLTGSGLGCPDWPTCTRQSYVAAFSFHPMVEFVNRVIVIAVTVLIAATMLGALARAPRRRDLAWLALALVAGYVAQIVLGGLTVLFKLAPPLVMAHLLLSMAMVWAAVVLFRRAGQPDTAATPMVAGSVVVLGRLIVVFLAVVLTAGTAVTGSGPHSGNIGAKRLPFAFSSAAEFHATAVLFLIGITVATLVVVHQSGVPVGVQRRGRVLLELMVVQGIVGYVQYFLHVPALLVELHVALATVVWIAALWFHLGLFHRAPEVVAASVVVGSSEGAGSPGDSSPAPVGAGAMAGSWAGMTPSPGALAGNGAGGAAARAAGGAAGAEA